MKGLLICLFLFLGFHHFAQERLGRSWDYVYGEYNSKQFEIDQGVDKENGIRWLWVGRDNCTVVYYFDLVSLKCTACTINPKTPKDFNDFKNLYDTSHKIVNESEWSLIKDGKKVSIQLLEDRVNGKYFAWGYKG